MHEPEDFANEPLDARSDLQQEESAVDADPVALAVKKIKIVYRRKEDFMSAENRLLLQIKSICRRMCDGDKTEGNRLFKAVAANEIGDSQVFDAWQYLVPFFEHCNGLHKHRAESEKMLRTLVKELPVYEWMKGVRGFGAGNLANIIGEAGNLSNYSSPPKLWKRMGLAVIEGGRQRCVTDAELAVRMGYSPKRRAVVYNLGTSLLRATDPPSQYKAIYDSRKVYESEKHPELAKMHIHRRAMRYMEKRAIRDLWRAWRGQVGE